MEDVTVTPSTQQQVVSASTGYYGINEVTVEPVTLQDKTVTPTDEAQVVTADEGYDGLNQVTVNPPTYADLSWIMEARAGNHPVVTAADMRKILSYIAQDYSGNSLLRYAPVTSIDFSEVDDVGVYGLAMFATNNSTLTSVSMPALTTVNKERALYNAFADCTGLTSVSFHALETVSGGYAMCQLCYNNSALQSADFSNTVSITGSYAFDSVFRGTSDLKMVTFPELVSITGTRAFGYVFYQSKIEEVFFPKLESISTADVFNYAFGSCTLITLSLPSLLNVTGSGRPLNNVFASTTTLRNLHIHPNALRYNVTNTGFAMNSSTITNLTLSTDASTNIYTGNNTLTTDSVKNVLEHCNNSNMNGKSVTFKAGLTITDDADGTLAALKTAVTAQGCTINNLTINPYTP